MSLSDRQLWDARYRQGAYSERLWPAAYLQQCMPEILARQTPKRALDVACGRGRNSIYAAQQGFAVDAVDVSAAALAHGARQAFQAAVTVNWRCQNLLGANAESGWQSNNEYGLILMFRFVAPSLLPALASNLALGGHLLIEEHMQWSGPEAVNGPNNPDFRVAPQALKEALLGCPQGLDIVDEFDGLVEEPDGSRAALSRIWVRRQR